MSQLIVSLPPGPQLSGLVQQGRPIEHVYSTLLSHQAPGEAQLGTVRVRYRPDEDADSADLHFTLRRQLETFLDLGRTEERLVSPEWLAGR